MFCDHVNILPISLTGTDECETIQIEYSGYYFANLKGVTVDESDGTIYFAVATVIFMKGVALDSTVEVFAGVPHAYVSTDGTMSEARFGGLEVSY